MSALAPFLSRTRIAYFTMRWPQPDSTCFRAWDRSRQHGPAGRRTASITLIRKSNVISRLCRTSKDRSN